MKTNRQQSASNIERRSFPLEMRREAGDQNGTIKLSGHAAVFNRETVLVPKDSWYEGSPEIREVIEPGAFSKTIQERDVRAVWNHNTDIVLGRKNNGTLKLREDQIGLANDIFPPDTQMVRDMCISPIERGDVDQQSFMFRIVRDKVEEEDGVIRITLKELELIEVSPCTIPAYAQTSISVSARSLARIDGLEERFRSEQVPSAPVETDDHPEIPQPPTPDVKDHPDKSRAMKTMEPMFKIGDRVTIMVTPHMDGHESGEIAEINRGPAYGIKFDGMDDEVHKWYVHSELEPEMEESEAANDESAPVMRHLDDEFDLRLDLALRRHRHAA